MPPGRADASPGRHPPAAGCERAVSGMAGASRPASLSGFPEWLPAERIVEQHFLDTIRRVFELHGFASLETRAVEPLETLTRKGEIDKEVYALRRLHAAEDEAASLGLHFDLTVPFARYVLEHAGRLDFPFRRYQIQKVWRGERPQDGRYREFTQADIDIIDRDALAFHHEVEIPLVVADALRALPIPPVRIQVNNRKLVEGFARGVGAADAAAVLRALDKLDKAGPEVVGGAAAVRGRPRRRRPRRAASRSPRSPPRTRPSPTGSAPWASTTRCSTRGWPSWCASSRPPPSTRPGWWSRTCGSPAGSTTTPARCTRPCCSATRTSARSARAAATTRWPRTAARPTRGSASRSASPGCSAGCSAAASSPRRARCPPACWSPSRDEDSRRSADRTAAVLRARGIATEVAPSAAKFGKQIRHADRRGIPYVWFAGADGEPDSVKDIRSGEQSPADPETWSPPAADLVPQLEEPTP